MAKTKKNNLLMISLLGIFLFGIILYLILKPKTNKSSNQGVEIQPIIIDSEIIRPGVFPETLRPGVFPETLRPGVFPEKLRPGVFPETLRPGVFPEKLRPGVFPETLRPGVFPEKLRPGVFPETLRPGVFPETLRPGVFPETLRPGVFPETLRPPGVQIVEGYAGSYVIDNILTIKLRTKYTGEGYEGNIELFDESGEYISTEIVRPIPLSSPDGFVYIILKDLPMQKIQFNLYIDGNKEKKVVFDLPDYLPPGVKYAKPVYNPIVTLKPVPPVTSKKPIPPVTTKKPLKICSGQLTLNSNKTDCCYKDETLLQSCTRANMNTVTPNCVSRTSLPYDKNISCCNTRSTQGNPLKYDVICKPKV